jgi:hypothetical protein
MDTRSIACLLPLLAALGGCGDAERQDAAPSEREVSEQPASADPAAKGRDLAALNVCELVPAEVVATAMGGSPAAAPEDHDPGFDGKGCRYSTRAGSRTRYAEVGLLPPDQFEFRRRMRSGESHDLAGLGDAAWWQSRSDRTDVNVLKGGDVALWIRFQENAARTREEEARRLGEAVLAELR